ncbi:MAG: FAD-dependent oxidoreductase [Planctomycetes bacterium]|nr:FAD-dependent oxidoreductase [Planctomycetota bacterium]
MDAFDCAVIGAGIHGLCTAFWLRQLGVGSLVVFEQGGEGHDRGSSHGATRITRSSYDDPRFVAMAQRAHRDGWPALERALGTTLCVPTPGLFFGPAAGPFAAWCAATLQPGVAVEPLPVPAARARFPQLRLADDDAALLDHTAAMLLAEDTMRGLRRWLRAHDVVLRFDTRVHALRRGTTAVELDAGTDRTTVHCRHVVLAGGAWSRQLAPAAADLVVLRQEVGYFALDTDAASLRAGAFPVWARIGDGANDFQYGLPDHLGSGPKLALHRTAGAGIDPDAAPPPIDLDALLALARSRFTAPVQALRRAERCLYTMSADHGFRVDTRAGVTTVLACSGHAFKFGPVVGRMAAERALAALA